MRLVDITMEDLPLYEALMTDPATMGELGGPLPREGLEDKLRGIVEEVRAGRAWYFTVAAEDPGVPVGTVCVWDHEWNGEAITEIGWMVLPAYQGRGLGSEAVRQVLRRAREDGRWQTIHAFPAVSNGPSNAICRKLGFTRIEELDFEYAGRALRGAHWALDLRAST
jgi:RimJ/RimL family protein N-acetyltransferase